MQSNELIEAFREENNLQDYGEELKLICSAPFQMMKEVIESGSFEEVRLQYLFVVGVNPSKIMKHLRDIYEKKRENRISQPAFDKYNSLLLSYIEKNPEKFEKYEQEIREITQTNFDV